MKDKSGNPSLLSNGVARTHFMPPDGACILTVLKPLQSLTGGSRLDALQNRRLTNHCAINIPSSTLQQERTFGVIYNCAFVFTPFLTHFIFRIRFFVGMILAAAHRRYHLKNAFYQDSGASSENFDYVFSRNK
jgi:hypothetical protein